MKLFERDTHSVSITLEGRLLFLRAQSILNELNLFRDELAAAGRLPGGEQPMLRIASYTSDSMYRILVDKIQAFPSDYLSKQCMFVFPSEGRMIETVMGGSAAIGVDSLDMVKKYGDTFRTKPLYRSPFHLIVGKNHPLYGRDKVSARELINLYGYFSDYLPAGNGEFSIGGKKLEGCEDLRIIGEYTISRLPQILPYLQINSKKKNPLADRMMLIIPRELVLFDFIDMHPVMLENETITTDYVLFWKKGNSDPDIFKLLEMVDLN